MIFAPTTVSLTKAELRALIAHSSADETRPSVNSILFNAAEKCAVATDGHRLAICEADGDKGAWSYLMPRAAAADALRAPKAEVYILNTVSQDLVAFDKSSRKIATYPAPRVNAEFPPFRQVLGTPSDHGVSQGFNARYLADAKLIAEAAPETERTNGVVFHPASGPLDPAHATAGRWTVVLMPMRCETAAKRSPTPVQSAPQAPPSAAIVLATRATSVEATPAPSRAIIVAPVTVLGSVTPAPVVTVAKLKSAEREWRETYVSTLDPEERAKPYVREWLADAA